MPSLTGRCSGWTNGRWTISPFFSIWLTRHRTIRYMLGRRILPSTRAFTTPVIRIFGEARYERMVKMGLVDPALSPLLPWTGSDWNALPEIERQKEIRRMEIYAAMLDRADQNIGRVLDKLRAQGQLQNTLIFFASDNGAEAGDSQAVNRSTRLEDFGTVASFEAVGQDWATVQNTPLRYWKNFAHEGGVRTPFIVTWPGKIGNPGGFIPRTRALLRCYADFGGVDRSDLSKRTQWE